jgi:hypothetical protein
VWLFGVLDVAKLDRLERYTAADVLHHVSTALNGTPVYLSNSNGLRYAFLLSQPPRLPRKVDFPGLQRGMAQLGVGIDGQAVAVPWKDLGHLLVAGMTGSGKSVFIQLLVYQALAEGAQLLVADMDGATLPMLAGHPALLEPIAATPDQARALIRRATGECSRRATLYATTKGYPADLDEYNALAVGRAKPVLPRVLVVLDEFNATVTALGGGRGGFAGDVAALAMRGRKFGLHAVLASQDFAKSSVGRVRDQMHAICFRVRSAELARSVGCAGAERIPARLSGRAVTDRWGIVQAFYLDKSLLVGVSLETPAPVLSELEQALVAWALRENDSYLGLADIQDRTGEGPRAARRLADEWEQRGWLAKDAQAGNKRRITGELATFADKLTNPTTPDKPTDRPANPTNPARSPAVEGEVS